MPARGRLTGLAVAGAAAAGVAAAGAALERSARSRRGLPALDPEGGYEHTPDEVLTVVASDGVRLHVEIDRPRALTGEASSNGDRRPAGGRTAYGTADWTHGEPMPTVILAHGFTLSCRSWVLQRRALTAAGHRVVSWDHRSHGLSGRSDDEHATIAQLGRDLADVIAAAAPEGDLVLVGHSMGGMTVMEFGGIHPEVLKERVVAVALVATSAGGGGLTNLGMSPAIGMLLGRVGPGLLHRLDRVSDLVTRVRRVGRPIEDAMVARYSFDSPVSQELVRFAADMIFATSFDAMGDFVPAIEAMDERAHLAAFHGIETIVINGAGDLLTPPEHSDRIVEGIPGSEHLVVEEAGHLIMLEHPEIVTQQIRMSVDRGVRARREQIAVHRKPRVRRTITDVARRRRVNRARAATR